MNSVGRSRADNRKQAVSVRMSRSDIRHIKQLANRLEVPEADVIRFAIKIMLEQLSPLQDPKAAGRSLLPVFMGMGAELMRYLELDASKLEAIINDGVEGARRVEPDDIQLIAMAGTRRHFAHLAVPGLRQLPPAATPVAPHANGGPGSGEGESLERTLQRYFYEKYLHSGTAVTPNGSGSIV
jgi:hypothetical protein